MPEPYIQHADVAKFADERVNLKREDVSAYRDQVNRLRAGRIYTGEPWLQPC